MHTYTPHYRYMHMHTVCYIVHMYTDTYYTVHMYHSYYIVYIAGYQWLTYRLYTILSCWLPMLALIIEYKYWDMS